MIIIAVQYLQYLSYVLCNKYILRPSYIVYKYEISHYNLTTSPNTIIIRIVCVKNRYYFKHIIVLYLHDIIIFVHVSRTLDSTTIHCILVYYRIQIFMHIIMVYTIIIHIIIYESSKIFYALGFFGRFVGAAI